MQNATEIRTWSVSWTIDQDATSAEQAARFVARDYLQGGHTATVFDVAPLEMAADNWGVPGAPAEVDTLGESHWTEIAGGWLKLESDLDEYSLSSDYERADVLAHVAHNLASLLPPAALKAAIDCAIADALTCLSPTTGQDKADALRRMMEGAQ